MKNSIICFCLFACVFALLTGQAAAWQEDMGEQVLEEINLARAEPLQYADYIREWRKHFKGKFYKLPGTTARRQTREGIAALNEAIEFLNLQKPLPPLIFSPELSAAAAELAREQAKSSTTGHNGAHSGGVAQNIRREGALKGQISKNIAYFPNEPRLLVMQLIVDDGVPDRSHRKNLFNTHFKEAGLACGSHQRFGTMCVADFSSGVKENRQSKDKIVQVQ